MALGNNSTVDALIILQNIIDVLFEKNKCLFISFIDLRKALIVPVTRHYGLIFLIME